MKKTKKNINFICTQNKYFITVKNLAVCFFWDKFPLDVAFIAEQKR